MACRRAVSFKYLRPELYDELNRKYIFVFIERQSEALPHSMFDVGRSMFDVDVVPDVVARGH